jgi:two-component sensor histidine kinase
VQGACLSLKDSTTLNFGSTGEIIPFDRSVLLAESDHRIANHLALLMSYVRLKTADMDRQRAAPSRQAVHALLDGVGAQIAAVAELHRALVSDDRLGSADLGERLHEVCAPFAGGLGGAARIVEDLAPGCIVGPDQILSLSQITAEIVTNALKHACDGAEAGPIVVRCRKDGPGDVRLEVIDSGGGFPAGFDPETDGGLGFRLVRGLSERLGARIAFESTASGVRFCLILTPAAPAQPRARRLE